MTAPRAASSWLTAAPAVFVMMWGGNQFTPLLSLYRDRLGFPDALVYALLSTYVVGLIPALIAGGRLGARFGYRAVLWTGLVSGAAASALLIAGVTSVEFTFVGRVVSGFSVGIAMTAGVGLIRALRIQREPMDRRGAIVRASMTVTAGLAAGATVAGILASWTPGPLLVPYLVHMLVALPAAGALLACRARRERPPARPPRALRRPVVRLGRAWTLTALAAPWVFVAGSVAYGLVPGLVRDIPSAQVPAYAALTALSTLVIGTVIQPWAGRLFAAGASPLALALTATAVGLAVVAVVSATGSALFGLAATVPLGAGFGVGMAAGLLRTQCVEERTGRRHLVGAFYGLTYVGFIAPAVVSAAAAVSDYTVILLSLSGSAATVAIALALLERRVGELLPS